MHLSRRKQQLAWWPPFWKNATSLFLPPSFPRSFSSRPPPPARPFVRERDGRGKHCWYRGKITKMKGLLASCIYNGFVVWIGRERFCWDPDAGRIIHCYLSKHFFVPSNWHFVKGQIISPYDTKIRRKEIRNSWNIFTGKKKYISLKVFLHCSLSSLNNKSYTCVRTIKKWAPESRIQLYSQALFDRGMRVRSFVLKEIDRTVVIV